MGTINKTSYLENIFNNVINSNNFECNWSKCISHLHAMWSQKWPILDERLCKNDFKFITGVRLTVLSI